MEEDFEITSRPDFAFLLNFAKIHCPTLVKCSNDRKAPRNFSKEETENIAFLVCISMWFLSCDFSKNNDEPFKDPNGAKVFPVSIQVLRFWKAGLRAFPSYLVPSGDHILKLCAKHTRDDLCSCFTYFSVYSRILEQSDLQTIRRCPNAELRYYLETAFYSIDHLCVVYQVQDDFEEYLAPSCRDAFTREYPNVSIRLACPISLSEFKRIYRHSQLSSRNFDNYLRCSWCNPSLFGLFSQWKKNGHKLSEKTIPQGMKANGFKRFLDINNLTDNLPSHMEKFQKMLDFFSNNRTIRMETLSDDVIKMLLKETNQDLHLFLKRFRDIQLEILKDPVKVAMQIKDHNDGIRAEYNKTLEEQRRKEEEAKRQEIEELRRVIEERQAEHQEQVSNSYPSKVTLFDFVELKIRK